MRRNKAKKLAALARRVFDIVEILENILRCLDTGSILRAQQVNRTFRDTVNGSLKTLKAIGVTPDYAYSLHPTPLWDNCKGMSFHGFNMHSFIRKWGREDDVNPEEVDIQLYLNPRIAVKLLGSRCRSITICQPPVPKLLLYWYAYPRKRSSSSSEEDSEEDEEDAGKRAGVEAITPTVRDFITLGDLQGSIRRFRGSWTSRDEVRISLRYDLTMRTEDEMANAVEDRRNAMRARGWTVVE